MPDYYPNPGESKGTKESSYTPEKEDSGMESALLPKSLFGGKEPKPGEEFVFKVVQVHGEEVEVEYATGSEKKDSENMAAADSKMDAMAMKNMGDSGAEEMA